MHCPLCEQVTPEQDRSRYFELAVCRACGAGEITLPLRTGERQLDAKFEPANELNTERYPARIRAIGVVTNPSAARFSVHRRTLWWRLLELITGNAKTGDDVFDDHVYVLGGRDSASANLLRNESVRASLLECTVTGSVAVKGATVTCNRTAPDLGYQDVKETARCMLVVMHYLSAPSMIP